VICIEITTYIGKNLPLYLQSILENQIVDENRIFIHVENSGSPIADHAGLGGIIDMVSLLQNDDFRSKSRHAKNFCRRHIIDIPRIKI
jgi:hypothetical protein